MERKMKRTLIRYKTKPDMADKNAELIAGGVCGIEGRAAGRRSLSFAAAGRRYVHPFRRDRADDGASALPKLAAFKAFQSGIRERCIEPPLARGVTIVGNYRMLDEEPEASFRRKQNEIGP